ncbi:hypothetical protein FHS95_001911 [Sphingomonas naasensis]|uniref:Four-helix bundle copper-binding protein n=1 Tax=Sphingomonas naasensis TaxID=1344951 RepID=A0A4V3QWY8_9SPHN|nr:four-helix bundle copper-binding protein [Sphingomonas naasensis]NIJ20219.1 hypothetical protein [Sphingomonas naasensis]TGX44362.1 four-helix bundle copper-binding protein [Sphingomonas naasensis]
MSIREMLSLHPERDGEVNDLLATAARHAMFCATMCTACADACLAEAMDMRQCVRACLDCADICQATTRLATRQTGDNARILRALLELCAHACEACAEECERHAHEHCRLCAKMCRECAQDCRSALGSML